MSDADKMTNYQKTYQSTNLIGAIRQKSEDREKEQYEIQNKFRLAYKGISKADIIACPAKEIYSRI